MIKGTDQKKEHIKRKCGLEESIAPSPPLLARRIKPGADSAFQAFHADPAQSLCRLTANRSTEGWHRKNKQAAGVHLSFARFPPSTLLLSLKLPD